MHRSSLLHLPRTETDNAKSQRSHQLPCRSAKVYGLGAAKPRAFAMLRPGAAKYKDLLGGDLMLRNRLTVFVSAAALSLITASSATHAASDKSTPEGAGADWAFVGGAADESSFSQLDQINTGNVGKLGLA